MPQKVAFPLLPLLALLAGSVLLRAPFFSVPLITDEGGYAYVATFWSADFQLYRDIPFDRPQAIFFLYRLAFLLLGTDVVAIRLFAALYNAITVCALFLFCRGSLGSREAWAAAALLAIFGASPRIEGFTANAELFMLLPIVVSAALTWKRQWFWAGLVGAMAVLLKPSGASALLLTLAWAVSLRAGPSAWVQMALGAGIGVLPSVVHGLWVGSEYFLQSLEMRFELYNSENVATTTQWHLLEAGLRRSVSAWAFLATAGVLAALKARGQALRFGALWLSFSILGIAAGGWWRTHYFMQLIPPLAFLASLGVWTLRPRWDSLAWATALLFGVFLFLERDVALAFQGPKQISWALYHRPGYLLADEISAYVRSNSREDETIYVAFAHADFYHLSNRRSAAPGYYYLLVEHSKRIFDSVIAAIEEREPVLVVLVQHPPQKRMGMGEFLEILDRGYVAVREFVSERGGTPITVYRRRPEARRDAVAAAT